MDVLLKIIQVILSLSLLVLVHEFGHYITARIFKIRVEKFSSSSPRRATPSSESDVSLWEVSAKYPE